MVAYREGSARAFRQLFERYTPLLLHALGLGIAPAVAEDLVQQTFLQLHRARFEYDPKQRFKPWLFTIAFNLKREHFRSLGRRRETASDSLEVPQPPRDHERVDASQTLRWALQHLPGEQREVIELFWFEGLSFPDVARCLGIGAVTAKVRAHRGYTRLRALLGGPAFPGNSPSAGGIGRT